MRRALLARCAVRRSVGRELRADQRLRPGRHGQERRDRRREGVPAQHRTAAAQPAAADGAAPEPVHQPREVRAATIRRGGARTAATFLFTQAYNDALDLRRPRRRRLSGGESSRRGCHGLCWRGSRPPLAASWSSRLATLNVTDAAAIAATNDTGQLRFNGRKHELPAIDALEAHVIDPSNEQSATAVLDKISGAASSPRGSGRRASSSWPASSSSC